MNKQHQNSIHRPAARSIPSPFQRRICWYALTGVSFLVMLGIAAFVIFEVVKLLGFLEPVLLPILIAAVIAYLLEPIVSWLVRRRFSRPLGRHYGYGCSSSHPGGIRCYHPAAAYPADG